MKRTSIYSSSHCIYDEKKYFCNATSDIRCGQTTVDDEIRKKITKEEKCENENSLQFKFFLKLSKMKKKKKPAQIQISYS